MSGWDEFMDELCICGDKRHAHAWIWDDRCISVRGCPCRRFESNRGRIGPIPYSYDLHNWTATSDTENRWFRSNQS